MSIIDLIRHGEPQGGRAYRGHGVDDPLSDKGWAQMRHAVKDFIPWQLIVSSPMRRCLEFAQELSQAQNIPLITQQGFKEVGFGQWEGRTPGQIKAENPDQYAAFYADPVNSRPPGAEPLQAFRDRVEEALQNILSQYSDKHILIVCHAGVIRAVIAHVLSATGAGMYKIKVENASLSRIRQTPQGLVLEKLNAKSSLD